MREQTLQLAKSNWLNWHRWNRKLENIEGKGTNLMNAVGYTETITSKIDGTNPLIAIISPSPSKFQVTCILIFPSRDSSLTLLFRYQFTLRSSLRRPSIHSYVQINPLLLNKYSMTAVRWVQVLSARFESLFLYSTELLPLPSYKRQRGPTLARSSQPNFHSTCPNDVSSDKLFPSHMWAQWLKLLSNYLQILMSWNSI